MGWVNREEGDLAEARSMFATSLAIARRTGDRSGMAYSVLGMACLAGDAEDAERSALLHGAVEALFASTGQTCQEPEEGYRLASLRRVEALVGTVELDRLRHRGRRLEPEDAVREAMAVRPA